MGTPEIKCRGLGVRKYHNPSTQTHAQNSSSTNFIDIISNDTPNKAGRRDRCTCTNWPKRQSHNKTQSDQPGFRNFVNFVKLYSVFQKLDLDNLTCRP